MKKTKKSCCSRNCRNVSAVGARNAACGKFAADVDLHGAHDERHPREQQQAEEARACAMQRPDAGARDHRPRAARAAPCRRRSGDSSGRGSACLTSALLLTHRLGEHVFERRHARPQVPHLHAARGASAKIARWSPPLAGHEHAHHVLVGRVALHARRRAARRRTPRRSPLTRSSKTRPRGPLQLVDRPLRRDLPLVHHDDVVAGVFDVGQQVRRQDQVDALVVRRDRGRARASRRGPSGPCRWSARRGTAGRDRARAPAPA